MTSITEEKKVFADSNGNKNEDNTDTDMDHLDQERGGDHVEGLAVAVAKQGHSPSPSKSHNSSIYSIMRHKKEHDRYELAEDVYAFIFVAPVCSVPFVFSCYVVTLKLIVFLILSSDIKYADFMVDNVAATTAKFFLIPVAIAMQEDLMHVFFCVANIMYCPSSLEISKSATRTKLWVSFGLRTIDGIFSLAVNFMVMLTTDTVLSVFLNFAALQFLQSIDDVFYELVVKGFFGDAMEHMSTICKKISFPRRSGTDNSLFLCLRISHLDSILFGVTFVILLFVFSVVTAVLHTPHN